jgi:predicted kinase
MLIIVFGLPGSGKTFFASALSQALNCKHLNTDMIRKNASSPIDYSTEGRIKIYEKILIETEKLLKNKEEVIVDGTFFKKELRSRFEKIATRLNIPVQYIEIKADENTIQKRVSHKRENSDADFEVYRKLKDEFEIMENMHLILWSDTMSLDEMIFESKKFLEKD